MEEYEVNINLEFLSVYLKKVSEESDGNGEEFVKVVELVKEYEDLINEYSENGAKLFKRISNQYEVSDQLMRFMTNSAPQSEYKNIKGQTLVELFQFNQLMRAGKIARTELYPTFEKAIPMKRKMEWARQRLIPKIVSKYDESGVLEHDLYEMFDAMIKQLDFMAQQVKK